MIRELGETGVTVLLSSHILAEVQQVCHSVSIIGDGRLLASGRVEDLVGEKRVPHPGRGGRPARRQARPRAAGYAVTRDGDHLVVEGHEHPEEITRLLAEQGIYVRELTPVRADLESFFLKLTGRPLPARTPRRDAPTKETALMTRLLARRADPVPLPARDRAARCSPRSSLAAVLVAIGGVEHPAADARRTAPTPRPRPPWRARSPSARREVRACRADPQAYFGPGRDRGRLRDAIVAPAESYYPPRRPRPRHGSRDDAASASRSSWSAC